MTTARHVTVYGVVQGVFFRAQTQRVAEEAGVTGWVANCDDGSVEAWLEGPRGAVDAVETWIRAGGPPRATVTSVDVTDTNPAGHTRFEIRS